MGIFKNILKKKDEVENDYTISELRPPKAQGTFTQEDLIASAETRRAKAEMRRMKLELEKRSIMREMRKMEFDDDIDMEERLERLKTLKMENMQAMGGGDGENADMMLMSLLNNIMAKQTPAPQQNSSNFGFGGPQMPQMPQPQPQEEEWTPQTRFTNEQMETIIKQKVPADVITMLKGLEEDEVLQAYDIIKTM